MNCNPSIDFFSNLDRLRIGDQKATLSGKGSKPTQELQFPKIKGEFLKGPIPLDWLTVAATIRAKSALAVGLALWFDLGRKKNKPIVVTTALLDRFGVNRKTKYSALRSLEKAGLITVERRPRKNPIATILSLQ